MDIQNSVLWMGRHRSNRERQAEDVNIINIIINLAVCKGKM
jgi:hypothetical protein